MSDFKNIASSEGAQSGLYYVPYQDDDGNVDFHEFWMQGQETEKDPSMMEVRKMNPDGQEEVIKIPYVGKQLPQ